MLKGGIKNGFRELREKGELSSNCKANGTRIDTNASSDWEERVITNVCVRVFAGICIIISSENKGYTPKGSTITSSLTPTVAILPLYFYRKCASCY